MKSNFIKYTAVALLFAVAASCDTDLPTYDYPNDGINFVDSVATFSFVYGDPDATQESFMIKITTMGDVPDRARRVDLRQELTGENDAVPGVHYVAFDDPSMAALHVIPAGVAELEIPVILLRDPSLENMEVVLKIRVKDNDNFGVGLVGSEFTRLTFTDRLTRPSEWNGGGYDDAYWLGAYGTAKHRWMIETTGEKWDDDYLYNVIGFDKTNTSTTNNPNIYRNDNWDDGYWTYLSGVLKRDLAAYNEELGSAGPLTEDDGTVVSFP